MKGMHQELNKMKVRVADPWATEPWRLPVPQCGVGQLSAWTLVFPVMSLVLSLDWQVPDISQSCLLFSCSPSLLTRSLYCPPLAVDSEVDKFSRHPQTLQTSPLAGGYFSSSPQVWEAVGTLTVIQLQDLSFTFRIFLVLITHWRAASQSFWATEQ